MTNTKTYIVPNYYKNFRCKGGDCRNSCCKGWDVTISMKEFFKLQELDCNTEVKALIEKALEPKNCYSKDQYGRIAKNEHNDCLLHMDNGLCLIHNQFGEEILPLICQYYP